MNVDIGPTSLDMDFADYFPNGMRVVGVGFSTTAAADILVLKEKTAAGTVSVSIEGSGSVTWARPVKLFPYLDVSACTITVDGKLIIQLA